MMTREEAVKWMEEAIQDTNTYWDSCSEALQKELNEQREVFLLAIDAILRADRKQKLEAENMELKERIINWRKYIAPTREQVEKVWKGCSWCNNEGKRPENWECSLLDDRGFSVVVGDEVVWTNAEFCPVCGKPLTDEAVEMVMQRLEALYDTDD